MSQVYTVTNQDKNANQIPNGDLVPRHFHNFEGEMYLQDKWNATPNLTITYGLRYSLLQPPYEADGNQVSPTIDMHQWFENRITNMYQGMVDQPLLSFGLSGQANGKKPYWNWNYKNVAPRFAIAYAPHADGGFWHSILGDKGKSSIRVGYGIYYDHFGEGVVNTFDRQGSWGLSTTISNPAGVLGVELRHAIPACWARPIFLPAPEFHHHTDFPTLRRTTPAPMAWLSLGESMTT